MSIIIPTHSLKVRKIYFSEVWSYESYNFRDILMIVAKKLITVWKIYINCCKRIFSCFSAQCTSYLKSTRQIVKVGSAGQRKKNV